MLEISEAWRPHYKQAAPTLCCLLKLETTGESTQLQVQLRCRMVHIYVAQCVDGHSGRMSPPDARGSPNLNAQCSVSCECVRNVSAYSEL